MEKHRCVCAGWNWGFEARSNDRKADLDAIEGFDERSSDVKCGSSMWMADGNILRSSKFFSLEA
jgi:hypothetical protein